MRTLLLPALLLTALPAFAATALTFEDVDTDGDGLISADEAASVEGLEFNVADADNDGTLSVDEYDIAVESLSTPTDPDPAPDAAQPTAPPSGNASAQPAAAPPAPNVDTTNPPPKP